MFMLKPLYVPVLFGSVTLFINFQQELHKHDQNCEHSYIFFKSNEKVKRYYCKCNFMVMNYYEWRLVLATIRSDEPLWLVSSIVMISNQPHAG